jgi:hypothetical protein
LATKGQDLEVYSADVVPGARTAYFLAQLDPFLRISGVVRRVMKTNSQTRFRPHSWSVPLACDLMPYLDKPRLRQALGGATVAGALLLGAANTKAQEPPVSFALRSIDGLQRISLWNLAVDYESHPPPQFVDADGDGDLDLIYRAAGMTPPHSSLLVWENTGTPYSPRFKRPRPLEEHPFQGMAFDTALADFDGDGDDDRALLNSRRYFENVGTAEEPDFIERMGGDNPLDGLPFVPIAAVDLDGDGYADLIDPDLGLHLNVPQNGARGFALEARRPFGDLHPFEQFDMVVFGDLDGDGDFDALVFEKAAEFSRQYYCENIGDSRMPVLVNRGGLPADFERGVFGGLPGRYLRYAVFADADGDGLPDAWEIRHFGDTTLWDGQSDPDNDGLTNAEELAHYTNPSRDAQIRRSGFRSWSDQDLQSGDARALSRTPTFQSTRGGFGDTIALNPGSSCSAREASVGFLLTNN